MSEENEEYNQLLSDKAQNEKNQKKTQDELDKIQQQIDDMKAAYDAIDAAKEDLKEIRKSIKKLPGKYDDNWKGSVANGVYESCKSDGDLYKAYTSFIDAIDDIEDDINNHIRDLKNEHSNQTGILRGLVEAWNGLCTAIQNFFN